MFLSPRWIIFLGMALVLCSIVANVIEAADPIGPNDTTIFTVIQSFKALTSADASGVVSSAIVIAPQSFTLLFKMLFWDYNFLHNFVGTIVRLLMFAISFAILVWMALVFIKR